jgi:hypothetical protein
VRTGFRLVQLPAALVLEPMVVPAGVAEVDIGDDAGGVDGDRHEAVGRRRLAGHLGTGHDIGAAPLNAQPWVAAVTT